MADGYVIEVLQRLLDAAGITLVLTFSCAAFGLLVAIPMGLARLSDNRLIYLVSTGFTFLFRGTPGLVQLYFLYYGVARLEFVRESVLWTVLQSPWWCAIIALSLNTGAYTTEIVRGSLMTVPVEQIEAAKSIGLAGRKLFFLIRLPLAVRIALPTYGNELVLLMKGTSIVSTITILDLMGEAKLIYTETFDPFVPMFTAAGIYLVLGLGVSRLIRFSELRFFRERKVERKPAALSGVALETGH
jgi:octopine/nopaline transport system permease protein